MSDASDVVTFYQNPFYDEVLFFMLDKPVPPKQRKGKSQNRTFEAQIMAQLNDGKKDYWPYTERVMVVLSITGPMSYLNNVDIDNVSKAILDTCKGILFQDDKQVFSLIAEKQIRLEQPTFLLGLRKLNDGEYAGFIPPLYSSNPDDWKVERFLKFGDQNL